MTIDWVDRNGISLPLPVGYTAVRDFKGVLFTQTILQGPHGPLFQISSSEGGIHVASTPQDVWKAAAAAQEWSIKYARSTAVRAFGFDSPLVHSLLEGLKPVAVGIMVNHSEQVDSRDIMKVEDRSSVPDASLAGDGFGGVLRLRPQEAEARTLHSAAASWASFAVLLEARENKAGKVGVAGGGAPLPTPSVSTRWPHFTAALRKRAEEKSREREETSGETAVVEKVSCKPNAPWEHPWGLSKVYGCRRLVAGALQLPLLSALCVSYAPCPCAPLCWR